MSDVKWYAIVNDLVGGWAVDTANLPMSLINPSRDEVVVADFCTEEDARYIAHLHNERVGA